MESLVPLCNSAQIGRSGIRKCLQKYKCNFARRHKNLIVWQQFHAVVPAGMKKTFGAFSTCFQHCAPALLLGCCDLLKPESNQPVAVRMEGLLSECNPLLLVHSSCVFAVAGVLHM